MNKSRMKHPVTLLVFITLFCTLTAWTKSECLILHKGTFKYGGISEEIIVKIKGKKHTEYHNNGKYVIESELNWVSDCEYNMTMTKITIPDFPYHPGDVMNVKIDKVQGKEIYYTSTVKGASWKGMLIKME